MREIELEENLIESDLRYLRETLKIATFIAFDKSNELNNEFPDQILTPAEIECVLLRLRNFTGYSSEDPLPSNEEVANVIGVNPEITASLFYSGIKKLRLYDRFNEVLQRIYPEIAKDLDTLNEGFIDTKSITPALDISDLYDLFLDFSGSQFSRDQQEKYIIRSLKASPIFRIINLLRDRDYIWELESVNLSSIHILTRNEEIILELFEDSFNSESIKTIIRNLYAKNGTHEQKQKSTIIGALFLNNEDKFESRNEMLESIKSLYKKIMLYGEYHSIDPELRALIPTEYKLFLEYIKIHLRPIEERRQEAKIA